MVDPRRKNEPQTQPFAKEQASQESKDDRDNTSRIERGNIALYLFQYITVALLQLVAPFARPKDTHNSIKYIKGTTTVEPSKKIRAFMLCQTNLQFIGGGNRVPTSVRSITPMQNILLVKPVNNELRALLKYTNVVEIFNKVQDIQRYVLQYVIVSNNPMPLTFSRGRSSTMHICIRITHVIMLMC